MQFVTIEKRKFLIIRHLSSKKSLKTSNQMILITLLSTDTKNKKNGYLWSVKRTQFLVCRERKGKNQTESVSLVGGVN